MVVKLKLINLFNKCFFFNYILERYLSIAKTYTNIKKKLCIVIIMIFKNLTAIKSINYVAIMFVTFIGIGYKASVK